MNVASVTVSAIIQGLMAGFAVVAGAGRTAVATGFCSFAVGSGI